MPIASVIDTSYKKPGSFIEVNFGAGPRSPGSASMSILLTGNKLASAPLAAATVTKVSGADEVRALAGEGSELHRMALAAYRANPIADLSIAVIASAGTGANGTLIFTGTATADGTVEVWVSGDRLVVPVTTGDTATVVGAAVAAAINARRVLPATAANVTGTVTLSARQTGPRGNRIALRSKLNGATGITHSAVNAYLASGATIDDPQAALDAVAPLRFHYVVSPHFTAAELVKYRNSLNTSALPVTGKRSRFVACIPDTLANAITLSDTVNAARGELCWLEDPDDMPGEVAAAHAATLAMYRSAKRSANMDGVTIQGAKVQFAPDDVPTAAEQNTALNNGLTPLLSANGALVIVRSITNYHNDPANNDDFSILDSHKVEVCDFVADTIEINFASQFRGFNLTNDPAPGAFTPPMTATPRLIRDFLANIALQYDGVLLENVVANNANIVVEIDGAAAGRANGAFPCDVVENFHQLGVAISQIG